MQKALGQSYEDRDSRKQQDALGTADSDYSIVMLRPKEEVGLWLKKQVS